MANGKVSYAIRTYVLGAGETVRIDRHSAFLVCLEASDLFKVAFDDGEENDFEGGITYSPQDGFQSVMLRNDGASANTVKLGFGKGNVTDSRLNLPGSITNREEVPDIFAQVYQLTVFASVLSTVFDANALRKEAGIVNEGANAVWINGGGSAEHGHMLEPGQSLILETTAKICAYTTAAGGTTLGRWETRFSA